MFEQMLIGVIAKTDYVSFTFFIGTMAMMAASVFFFLELNNTSKEWRTSVLVSGLITFIAAVHYYYMREYFLDRKSTRLNSSHVSESRMPSSA